MGLTVSCWVTLLPSSLYIATLWMIRMYLLWQCPPLLFLPKDLSFGASGRSVPSEESDCCSFLFLTVASRHLWARTADYRMERQSQSVSPPISTIFFAVVRKTARKSSHPVYEIVIYHVMFLACKKKFFLNLLFCFFSCALFSPSCFALYLWLPGF